MGSQLANYIDNLTNYAHSLPYYEQISVISKLIHHYSHRQQSSLSTSQRISQIK